VGSTSAVKVCEIGLNIFSFPSLNMQEDEAKERDTVRQCAVIYWTEGSVKKTKLPLELKQHDTWRLALSKITGCPGGPNGEFVIEMPDPDDGDLVERLDLDSPIPWPPSEPLRLQLVSVPGPLDALDPSAVVALTGNARVEKVCTPHSTTLSLALPTHSHAHTHTHTHARARHPVGQRPWLGYVSP